MEPTYNTLYTSGTKLISCVFTATDEEALVKAAKRCGFNFVERSGNSVTVNVVSVCVVYVLYVPDGECDCSGKYVHGISVSPLSLGNPESMKC